MNNGPSQLGKLPTDWARKKLGAITKVRQGLQIAISDRLTAPTSESKEYITIQSINKKDQAREYIHAPSKRVICNQNDVLMTRTGNTGIVVTGVDGVFHNNFFLIDFDRKLIDGSYLVEYLRTSRVQYLILTKAGTSTIPDLNHKDFYSIEFPVPPFLEQKKIAQILSTWDKAIATTEKLLEYSQKQKQALMQQLLTGKRKFSGFNGGWKKAELGELLEYKQPTEFIVNSDEYSKLSDKFPVPVLTAGKTFILGYTNEQNGIYEKNLPVIIFDDFTTASKYVDFPFKVKSSAIKILTARSGVSIKYVYEAMQLIKYQIGGHQRHWISIFSNIIIKLPKFEEQKKIASILSTADTEINTFHEKLECLKNEKKALMQQLLSGKIRVRIDS